MPKKTLATISILAALLVLFSAMLEPIVSALIAGLALLVLGFYMMINRNRDSSAAHKNDNIEHPPASSKTGNSKKQSALVQKQAEEKEYNKETILDLFKTKNSLTNNDVEKFLAVSDATATRYLDELEKEGKIKQIGKTGRFVTYIKT